MNFYTLSITTLYFTMVSYTAIGLMSGTSCDGLDIAYCHFIKNETIWEYTIQQATTIAYTPEWKQKWQHAATLSAWNMALLDVEVGRYFGEQVNLFLTKYNLPKPTIIASHGHTIFHAPAQGVSLQIGCLATIAATTKIPTIGDFRRLDVALQGQGAPLVPVADALLFNKYTACLNIGGFANISLEDETGNRIAWDTCPANIILNKLTQKIGLEYDKGGEIAATGVLMEDLYKELNALDFYTQKPPKSLGREWVEQCINPLLQRYEQENIQNTIHTITQHIALQIATTCNNYTIDTLLVTGGGAWNTYLIESIKKQTATTILIPESKIVDFKEALAFAFLGILRHTHTINTLASVTGATQNSIGGSSWYI